MDRDLVHLQQLAQLAHGCLKQGIHIEGAAEASGNLTKRLFALRSPLGLSQQAGILERQGNLGAHFLHQGNLLRGPRLELRFSPQDDESQGLPAQADGGSQTMAVGLDGLR